MLSTLSVGQSGLNAAKIATENVSNNIANENTPGYKKRVVQLSEIEQVNGKLTGRGVSADQTYRITSTYMYDKLVQENTKSAYYDKLTSMLGNVESIFKETDSSGISANISNYLESIDKLKTNPNSQIYKSKLAVDGKALVESLQNAYKSVEKLQKLDLEDLQRNANKVNSLLEDIANVNQSMARYSATNDLLDKRDRLELKLSQYVDIEVSKSDGIYQLDIAGRTAVYNTSASDFGIKEEKKAQTDKFTHIDFSTKPSTSYDSLKYKDDFTARSYANGDVVTYKLNNQYEVSVTIGESITMDWNSDGTNTTEVVASDGSNLIRALVNKINTNANMKDSITAYNGDYILDENGKKITTDTKDNFLRIEAVKDGVEASFSGRVSIVNNGDDRTSVYKNDFQSKEALSSVAVTIYDREIKLNSGRLKASIENLSSNSENNKFQSYLNKLDALAKTLSDITDKYIQTDQNKYIYGEAASDESSNTIIKNIGLFSGASVKTLEFNKNSINSLNQEKLDYLASIQWKKNISFEGKAQNENSSTVTSLKEFFRETRVSISSDQENVKFSKEAQDTVKNSLQTSYNELVKVDKDEEMVNLIKFQAAYTANAKIITTIDEMLQVLLGLKR